MKAKSIGFVAACAVLAAWAAIVQADPPPLTLWTTQIGTSESDPARGIAVDAGGNSYFTGLTFGDLGGPNQGLCDAFIIACDSSGTQQWIRQIGTSECDAGRGIAVDASGNSYITGETDGDLGGPNQGSWDAFIIKCGSGGTLQWASQIGTSHHDRGRDIAVDVSGNSYITGHTWGDLGGPNQGGADAFLVKYNTSGTVQWARQIGTDTLDWPNGIAVDGSGNSYITGVTEGDLGGPYQGGLGDGFILKYDSGGTFQWARQIGTTERDEARGIAVDGSGNSYVTGHTYGDLGGPSHGGADAFVVKYDTSGTWQWTRQIGTTEHDGAWAIAVDSSGNSYIRGGTAGEGGFIVKYDSGGTEQWRRQIGTIGNLFGWGIAVDGSGNIYITSGAFMMVIGTTPASFGDANLDACVDGLDYVIWSNYYEPFVGGKTWGHGDFNEDGCVDGLDYVAWSNNYLVGCPAAGSVPEPTGFLLLALGGLALIRRKP